MVSLNISCYLPCDTLRNGCATHLEEGCCVNLSCAARARGYGLLTRAEQQETGALRTVKIKFGISTSSIYFSREIDLVKSPTIFLIKKI